MRLTSRLLAGAVVAAAALPSFAVTTVYSSSAAFLANVGPGAYTETFTGSANVLNSPLAFSGGAFGYSVSTPTVTNGLYRSGTFLGTTFGNQSITVTFTGGSPTAIGGNFYITNIDDLFVASPVTINLSDGTSTTFTPTSAASYRGFTSTVAITSLVLTAPGSSNFNALDNLTVGLVTTPVPEPASLVLLALGIAGLALHRRGAR